MSTPQVLWFSRFRGVLLEAGMVAGFPRSLQLSQAHVAAGGRGICGKLAVAGGQGGAGRGGLWPQDPSSAAASEPHCRRLAVLQAAWWGRQPGGGAAGRAGPWLFLLCLCYMQQLVSPTPREWRLWKPTLCRPENEAADMRSLRDRLWGNNQLSCVAAASPNSPRGACCRTYIAGRLRICVLHAMPGFHIHCKPNT
jgi:hypothetical protein